ncbi:MAG: MucR family transcriptional regulator [Magnetococcales bacterium]|nr:MucR family transcriptional regulator [Magnetococcales bacterium]MBF0157753.1 MucR family transcriptional regulator [Magnetococcales bacterium]
MSTDILRCTAEIVAAFVSNNEVAASQVPSLLRDVFQAMVSLAEGRGVPAAGVSREPLRGRGMGEGESPEAAPAPLQPAVPLDQAVTEEGIVCLVCGRNCRSLRGHLTRSHRMDAHSYLRLFGLPRDYPMVAPSYSSLRRKLAIQSGLGERRSPARGGQGSAV